MGTCDEFNVDGTEGVAGAALESDAGAEVGVALESVEGAEPASGVAELGGTGPMSELVSEPVLGVGAGAGAEVSPVAVAAVSCRWSR